MFNFCIDCTYLSVSRRNAVGENSKILRQIHSHCSVCHPIIYLFVCKQYHVIPSSVGHTEVPHHESKKRYTKNVVDNVLYIPVSTLANTA